ncbi:helix-turn-helix domain-containing protein [Streptomyces europaeiscabiei]|uniref:helix-turn-helix domain-containing protein n=1 Tax=Streptomyces europaeiscabiei TaxID=146819 RepID=UPI0038D498E2
MTTWTGTMTVPGGVRSRRSGPQPTAPPAGSPISYTPTTGTSGAPTTPTPAGVARLARFDPPLDLPVVPKHRRLVGQGAQEFETKVIAAYTERKAGIRDICAATTRSYGAIHGLLKRYGVQLRGRGRRAAQPRRHFVRTCSDDGT